jgi:hypothetical protein
MAHLVVLLRFRISRLQAALRSRLIDMATRRSALNKQSYTHPLRARFGSADVNRLLHREMAVRATLASSDLESLSDRDRCGTAGGQ